MYWVKFKWKMLVCVVLIVMLLGALSRCSGSPPIDGTAIIIDFDYGVYSGNVSFRAIVLGSTAYGEKVVRRWSISSSQFQQLEIGDKIHRVNGRVIRVE